MTIRPDLIDELLVQPRRHEVCYPLRFVARMASGGVGMEVPLLGAPEQLQPFIVLCRIMIPASPFKPATHLELDWRSLKIRCRQHSLPKVPFAAKTLSKDFFTSPEKGEPYLPVKSVLAAVFLWQRGTVIWQSFFSTSSVKAHLALLMWLQSR